MNNKRHNIIDDAWDMKAENLGGAAHTLRVGLAVNTVAEAKPVVIDDVLKLYVDKPKLDHKTLLGTLPVLLHASHEGLQVAILVVLDKDSNHIQCIPFNNLNDGGKWWIYEIGFDIVPGGLIEIAPIHPIIADVEPTEGMMVHLEALVSIVSSYLHKVQHGEIELYEQSEDFSKINKKRSLSKKTPIVNNWKIKYVSE